MKYFRFFNELIRQKRFNKHIHKEEKGNGKEKL